MKKVKRLFAILAAASFVITSGSAVLAADQDRDRDRDQTKDNKQDKLKDGSCQASTFIQITDDLYVYQNGTEKGDKDQLQEKDQIRDC